MNTPRKIRPRDRIPAATINAVAAMAARGTPLKLRGAAHGYDRGVAAAPSHDQEIVEIAEEIDHTAGLYLVRRRYFNNGWGTNFEEGTFALDCSEFLPHCPIYGTLEPGDRIAAWFDAARQMFLPLTTPPDIFVAWGNVFNFEIFSEESEGSSGSSGNSSAGSGDAHKDIHIVPIGWSLGTTGGPDEGESRHFDANVDGDGNGDGGLRVQYDGVYLVLVEINFEREMGSVLSEESSPSSQSQGSSNSSSSSSTSSSSSSSSSTTVDCCTKNTRDIQTLTANLEALRRNAARALQVEGSVFVQSPHAENIVGDQHRAFSVYAPDFSMNAVGQLVIHEVLVMTHRDVLYIKVANIDNRDEENTHGIAAFAHVIRLAGIYDDSEDNESDESDSA